MTFQFPGSGLSYTKFILFYKDIFAITMSDFPEICIVIEGLYSALRPRLYKLFLAVPVQQHQRGGCDTKYLS